MNAFRCEMTLQLVAVCTRDKLSSNFKSLQRLKKKKSTPQRRSSRYDVGDVEY